MDELMVSVEEAFFERYFEYGDDKDTVFSNLESSLDVFFRSHKECSVFAEQISDGEVVDVPTVMLALQNLILSHKYEEQFKKSLGADGPIIDITNIDISGKSIQELASEGTALISKAKASLNLSDLEKGKYLLFAAMS